MSLNVLNKQNFVLDSNTSALIQVEEAQRVRKRRRDERCLLDIHKRQNCIIVKTECINCVTKLYMGLCAGISREIQ